MAKVGHNGLIMYLQHRPKILLHNLDLFISALLGSSLTFCYILIPPDRRLPTGQTVSGSVSGCSVVRPAQLLTKWRRQDVSGKAASGIIRFPQTESSKFCFYQFTELKIELTIIIWLPHDWPSITVVPTILDLCPIQLRADRKLQTNLPL